MKTTTSGKGWVINNARCHALELLTCTLRAPRGTKRFLTSGFTLFPR